MTHTSRTASGTHLVLIPSYNPGVKVDETVRGALAQWAPVWVVVDGSTDGSAARLQAMAEGDDRLRVLVLPRNVGKGAAVLHGITQAAAQGFTHALTMDSDGQHPADLIPAFMPISDSLRLRLRNWNHIWQSVLDPVKVIRWPDPEVGRQWIAEGEILVRDLQEELGPQLHVVEGFRVYDPDGEDAPGS